MKRWQPVARRARGRRGGRSVPDLKRRKAQLAPRRRFILFLEGGKTEPAYFDALQRACRGALIDIESHPGMGVPYTIAEKAVERARKLGLAPRSRRRKDSFEDRDQVWAVFDRDEHPRSVRKPVDNGRATDNRDSGCRQTRTLESLKSRHHASHASSSR